MQNFFSSISSRIFTRQIHTSSFLFWFVCILVLVYYHTHGYVLFDEGYIVNSGYRMLLGEIPYRDFHFVYTPGSIFFTLLGFFLFGESILAERIIAFALSLIACIIIFQIGTRIAKKRVYSYLLVLSYIAWGSSHINFIWPVMLAISGGFLWCILIIKSIEKKHTLYLFFAGITAICVFLSKQNFVVAILASAIAAYSTNPSLRNKKSILYFLYGVVLSLFIFILYLVTTFSLQEFIDDFYVHTIKRVILDKDIDSLFLYGGTPFWYLARAVIYLFPLYISIFAGVVVFLKKRKMLFIPVLTLFYYLLGIRPTTDYVHLVPLIAMCGVNLVLIIGTTKNKIIQRFFILVLLFLILTGFYTSLYKGYYRYLDPMITYNTFSSNSRVKVWVSKDMNRFVNEYTSFFEKRDNTNEYIYVNEYLPFLYFLAGKKNPTSHDVISLSKFYDSERPKMIRDIALRKTPFVVTFSEWKGTNLASFITKEYEQEKDMGYFMIWSKK